MASIRLFDGRRQGAKRFEALVRQHYMSLYRVAYRWTQSVEDAEDLVQETCGRAWRRFEEIEQLERPSAWMMRVMYRLFVDLTRRHDRRQVDALDDSLLATLEAGSPGPDEQAEWSAKAARLVSVWPHIDRDNRALLALHDIEGYTLAELTEITGLKEGTLKSRLHRARVLLGRMLQAGTGEVRHIGGGKRL
ncbi:MAG TPA: RNA polymerase sigma factor [Woeseiaceae bacterium]|nr:RNA polymerase sigma factor [Woeseiaceae bacterium]